MGELSNSLRVLAVDRTEETDESFRAAARNQLQRHLPELDPAHAEHVLDRLSYRRADVTSAEQLRTALPEVSETAAVFYLALPNAVFQPALHALSELRLRPGARLVVEKPFGVDQADARGLNDSIRRCFAEDDVFRIDHFLAKQTVLDILGLRFANRVFENRSWPPGTPTPSLWRNTRPARTGPGCSRTRD